MDLLELYYSAFRALRDYTQDDSNSQRLRKVIARSKHQNDVLTAIKYGCTIEPDWVENIEEGLIYIEKAIKEERQFIRTEGEVVPIEKVKRVSKASVEHLSRHTDLITRAPKDKKDNLIPDELYVVEKLNDYQVYENRFIYMLLCYLKDFIQMRLVNIKDKTTTYQSHMEINKGLNKDQRHLEYQLNYNDVFKNDPLLVDRYKQIPMVDRIETIYALTVSLLNTPLMREVSKAALIKPPVVKTNVLRMNQNFRAALKLYDFVTAYNKDGYTINEIKKSFNPFPAEMGDEIADTIQLVSNIAYIEGNGLRDDLEKSLALRIREQKEAEAEKTKNEIQRLKKRIVEMHEDPSEYILKLEKSNAQLEKASSQLTSEREKNEELTKTIETLEDDKSELEKQQHALQEKLSDKTSEIQSLNQKYFDDMTEAEKIHQQEIEDIKQKHHDHIEALNAEHETSINALNEEHKQKEQELITFYDNQYNELVQTYASEKQALMNEHKEAQAALETKIDELNESIDSLKSEIKQMHVDYERSSEMYQQRIQTLEKKLNRLYDEKKYEKARYLALKKEQGLITSEDDFTSKEQFKQMESEMTAYKKLFKEQWKEAKREIRKNAKEEVFMDQRNKENTKDK